MMCALVVSRLKLGAFEDFRRAWEPTASEQWARGMTRLWMARADDDPDVVATWGLFDLDQAGLDALRDDPTWIASEGSRMPRMGEFEQELVASGFFEIVEEIIPPGNAPGEQ
jgi:hypothetical protein